MAKHIPKEPQRMEWAGFIAHSPSLTDPSQNLRRTSNHTCVLYSVLYTLSTSSASYLWSL